MSIPLRAALFLLLFALPASPSSAAVDPDAGKEMSIEAFLQTLSSVPGTVQRRDPFTQVPPPFGEPEAFQPTVEGRPPVNMDANPLERYPVESYEVVAVLLSEQPRALVRIPKEPNGDTKPAQVLIVKLHDKLGDRKGVVTKVTYEGISVQQVSAPKGKGKAVEKWDTFLKVGASAEQQRRVAEELKDEKKMVIKPRPLYMVE